MHIITIGREFGSGGRELGKRLADALGVACYDREIIAEVARLQGIGPEYVERISQADVGQVYSGTIGRTLAATPVRYNQTAIQVLADQQTVIRRLAAQGDCVIVGQNADVILQDMAPLNLFIYASCQARLDRCLAHLRPGETEKGLRAQIKRVDKNRAATRRLLTDSPWGRREDYHLCINTSGADIKALVPALAEYAQAWFASSMALGFSLGPKR